MTFSEACKILNIEKFPVEMDAIYEDLQRTGKLPFDRDMLVRFQESYHLFGDYYDAVLEGFDDLSRDEARRVWSYTVAAYGLTHSGDEMRSIKVPVTDGTPAGHMAALFPLVCHSDETYAEYRRRGFSHEETMYYLQAYYRGMGVTLRKTGKPGLQQTYFDWSSLYTYVSIFLIGGFNFQLCSVPPTLHVLRHKESRELCILLHDTRFHKSGLPLGSAGCTEEEGAYDTSFEESEGEIIGYPVVDLICPNKAQRFSKDQWEIAAAPGDELFGLHIPTGTDLSPESVANAIEKALTLASERFPERKIKGLRCVSWLLSPQLEELLGENSRIVRFSKLFVRYPVKNPATGVFNFAFDGVPADYHDLPENTTLQRKVKAHYLAGRYVYNYGGYILDPIE